MAAPLVTRSFTVDEYHRMAEAGILHEDDRVELLDGQVVEMTPIGPRHARCVDGLAGMFTWRLGDGVIVRIQNPLAVGIHQEPEPDVALVRLRPGRYGDAHPGPRDVLLVVEVAESSLATDRDNKLPIYASAGIQDVWIVDLGHERIERYRSPTPRGYQEVHTFTCGDTVTALLVPTGEMAVSEILG
jgi:Uma2 family endonuclease